MRWAAVAIAAALLLGGCEKATRPSCPPGKLCMNVGNMADPTTLDPHKSTMVQADNILGDMFVGLVAQDAQSRAIPGVATTWSSSPDGLTWTFKLRHDARWSDGTPITARDFVYSMRRLEDPATAGEYAYLAYVIRNAKAVNTGKAPLTTLGVAAPDPYTVTITLEHPTAFLPGLLTHNIFYPAPEHVVRRWGAAWTKPGRMVTNGAFTLASWNLSDHVRLVKNPQFYDAKNVCLDEVSYYPTNDSISAERRVLSGELDANVDIQSNRIPYLKRTHPEVVRTNSWLGIDFLAFNTRLPMFKDRRVRQALSMAVDRDFIAGKLLAGGPRPAYAFVPPGVAGYPGSAKAYWADWPLARRQAEARRLLAAAGYGPGHPLRPDIKVRNTADPLLIMPAIQADWRVVGVEASLTPNESQIAYAAFRVRDFQVADASWIADFDDAVNFLDLFQSSTGAINYGDYNNPAYDAVLAEAAKEPDAGRRAGLLVRAEQMMLDDAPVIPVYFYISKNLVRPEVTGWEENVADWHRKRFVCFKDAEARRRAGN